MAIHVKKGTAQHMEQSLSVISYQLTVMSFGCLLTDF